MKKVIFMLAFVLISSFSFANKKETVKIEKETVKSEIIKIEVNDLIKVLDENTDLPVRCRIIHNVYNSDGVLTYTRTYVLTLSSGTCQNASNNRIQETIDAYNELFD